MTMGDKSDSTTNTFRCSQETKDSIKKWEHGEATKFLKVQTIQHNHRKEVDVPNFNWLSIPFKEYNFLLGGMVYNSDGELEPIYIQNATQVINFCRLIKKQKATKSKLSGEQNPNVLRFEDVYHVVEHFHKMNQVDIKLIRHIDATIIESSHSVGSNWSKFLVELFTQTANITQEYEVQGQVIRDNTLNDDGIHDPSRKSDLENDGVKIYMKFIDNVDFDDQQAQSDFAW